MDERSDMSRVNDLIEIAKDAAKDIIETEGQYHVPRLIMDCPNSHIEVIRFNRMNESVKANFQAKLKTLLSEHKATAYIFVFEGWAAEEEAAIKVENISDLPLDDRSEILLMVVCEKGNPPWMIHAKIHNTPQGRKVGEYEELKPPEGSIEGRMVVTNW